MNIKRLFQSFKDAVRGVVYVFRHEQNFRLQVLAAILVLLGCWFFTMRKSEMIVMGLLILLVLILELLNSAVERLADVLKPRLSWQIQVVKDVMAATVFLASLGSLIIGIIIFWPYVFELFRQM
jgi:diacylglycerol kinase